MRRRRCGRWRATMHFSCSHLDCSTLRCLRRRFCRCRRRTRCAKAWDSSRAWTRDFKEAPTFYWLYTLLIVGGAISVLILPDAQLINFAILSQVLNGVLLPVVIILMLMLINRQDLMGKHKNSHLWNVVAWGTSIIVIGMTGVMLWGMIPGH